MKVPQTTIFANTKTEGGKPAFRDHDVIVRTNSSLSKRKRSSVYRVWGVTMGDGRMGKQAPICDHEGGGESKVGVWGRT